MNAEEAREASKQAADTLHKAAKEAKERKRLASIEKEKQEREAFIVRLKSNLEYSIKEAIKKGDQSCSVDLKSYNNSVTVEEFKNEFYYFNEVEKIKRTYQKEGYDVCYKVYSETKYVWHNYELGDGDYETYYYVALEIKWS